MDDNERPRPTAIIDDQQLWLRPLATVLRDQAHRLAVFATPEAALVAAGSMRPRAVLMVDRMPNRDAADVARAFRVRLGSPCPPLVLVEDPEAPLPEEDRELFAGIYPKPLAPRELLEVLDTPWVAPTRRSSGIQRIVRVPDGDQETFAVAGDLSRFDHDTTQGPTVALVDDQPLVLRTLGEALRGFGFRTLLFEHPASALDVLAQGGVDLVITDYTMPGMSGGELARRLRALGATAHLPILLMTGDPDRVPTDELRFFDAVHAKPVHCDALRDAILRAVAGASSVATG